MKNLNDMFNDLYNSNNEEEVTSNLKSIIKGYNPNLYMDKIENNPYFISLISDIKFDVITEISLIKSDILNELYNIEKELIQSNNTESFMKLKDLKRECKRLIREIDERISMIKLI